MAVLWFLGGVCCTLTCIILLLPWLRTIPGWSTLPALPWQAGLAALATAGAVVGICMWLQPLGSAAAPQELTPSATAGRGLAGDSAADPWAGVTNALGRSAGVVSNSTPSTGTAAGSMSSAVASLQGRLAKGGGSADDWELLAKSYEFLGRPEDAAKARSHQLPSLPTTTAGAPANGKVIR